MIFNNNKKPETLQVSQTNQNKQYIELENISSVKNSRKRLKQSQKIKKTQEENSETNEKQANSTNERSTNLIKVEPTKKIKKQKLGEQSVDEDIPQLTQEIFFNKQKNRKSIKKLPPLQYHTQKYQQTVEDISPSTPLRLRTNKTSIKCIDIIDIKQFITKPVQFSRFIPAIFHLSKSCCQNKYELYMKEDSRLLLSVQKKRGLNSKYLILTEDVQYGQIQSNFIGSQFNVYQQNQLIATICYFWGCSFFQTFRKIQIFIRNTQFQMEALDGKGSLKQRFNEGQNAINRKIIKFVNKQPSYNPQTNSYMLNFSGLAKMISTKNCIIVQESTRRQILMCAKKDHNLFNVLIFQSLSPLIAMGIIASMFNFKIISQ